MSLEFSSPIDQATRRAPVKPDQSPSDSRGPSASAQAAWQAALADARLDSASPETGTKSYVRVAQALPVPVGAGPLPVPVPPMAIPGTPENKAATEPLAKTIINSIAPGEVIGRRFDYLGEQLRQGNLGAFAGTLFHITPFPDDVNFGQANPAPNPGLPGGHRPPPAAAIPESKPQIVSTPIQDPPRQQAIGGGFQGEPIGGNLPGYVPPALPVDTTKVESRKNDDIGNVQGGSATSRPENLAPSNADRDTALQAAKDAAGIPHDPPQDPEILPNTRDGKNVKGSEILQYLDKDGNIVQIRHDYGGHNYPDDPVQDRGPHFNTPDGGHYDYSGRGLPFGPFRK